MYIILLYMWLNVAAVFGIHLNVMSSDEPFPAGPYIYFELPSGLRLFHSVSKGKIPGLFDYQRNTLARLLGTPERADWKQCKQTEEEEIAMVEKIKERFAPYDFTISS